MSEMLLHLTCDQGRQLWAPHLRRLLG